MVNDETKMEYGEKYIGNVIRIIDSRTLLVNVGRYDLKVGQTVQVYELGEEIKDLDGRILSNYIFVKDELEVVQVEDSYSVCQKQETVTETYSFALSPLLETKHTKYIPLNIAKNDIQELKPQDPLVRVGDPIKLA